MSTSFEIDSAASLQGVTASAWTAGGLEGWGASATSGEVCGFSWVTKSHVAGVPDVGVRDENP